MEGRDVIISKITLIIEYFDDYYVQNIYFCIIFIPLVVICQLENLLEVYIYENI